MPDALGDYLRTIGRIPLLTAAEEVHLATMVQNWLRDPDPSRHLERRGRKAMQRMVCANLRLVVSVCMRHNRRISHLQIELLDLVQAGNLGLIRAVERFDPARGYKFSTYGYWWIRQAVNRYLRERVQPIRVPAEICELAKRAEALQSLHGGRMGKQELAGLLGESVERVEYVLEVQHRTSTLSLDQRISSEESESNLIDMISDGEQPAPQDDYHWLHNQVEQLDPRERTVIQLRYGSPDSLSMARVAELTGLKKGQVQWIEKQALQKLRRHLTPQLNPALPRSAGPAAGLRR